jgi:hypothetical protein
MTCAGADGGCDGAASVIADALEARGYLAVLGAAREVIAALDAAGFAILRKPAGGALPPPRDDRGAWPTAAAQA